MAINVGRTMERLRTVPGLLRDVAVLALVVVLSVGVFLWINSNIAGTLPWQKEFVFKAEFTSVPALDPNSNHNVTMAGVRIGDVADWEATQRGTAIVTFALDPGTNAKIYQNAGAVLRAKNPLNEMHIEVSPGDAGQGEMPENGLIPIGNTKTIVLADTALANLDQRARAALTSLSLSADVALARAPEQLPGGLRAVDKTVVDARPVMEALQTRREKISQLVTAVSRIAGAVGGNRERAVQLAGSTQETLGVLAENDADLRATLEQLPGLNQELRSALSATQPLTEQLDPVLRDLNAASDDLPDALDRFESTIDEFDDVVDAAEPFLKEARPVVSDLRPLVGDLDESLDDLKVVSGPLGRDVQILETYLDPLRAFIYNTSSVFGVKDAQGSNVRGFFVAEPPDNQVLPGGETRNNPGAANGLEPGDAKKATPPPAGDRVPNQEGPERGKNPLLPMMGAVTGNGSN